MKRNCTKCGAEKPLEQFGFQKRGKHGRRATCRDCYNAYIRGHVKSDAWRRRANVKRYGISVAQYDSMLAAQGGKCLLCGCLPEHAMWGRLCIDHDHTTGRVRGLLCGLCNSGIGKLKDNPALLRAAADYLERS